MSKLLGSIRDVLSNKSTTPMQRNKMVTPSSVMSPPLSFFAAFPIGLGSDPTLGSALDSPGSSIPSKKPIAECRIGTTPSSSCSKAYAPGCTITGHSLLSGDTSAQEWSGYAYSLATMRFLAGKSRDQVVGDLRYAAAQASALMVAAADRVFHVGVIEAQLTPLHNTIVSLKDGLQDAEAELHILSKQNYVVAYEISIQERHVLTLEDQTERLEDQVSVLT